MSEKVVIIGAGIAGLVAALELEERGFSPVILEYSDSIGGRVKSTIMDGYTLDHGFQVLLTAYPEAQHYLDYDKLDLRYFEPGAIIYGGNKPYILEDPRRNFIKALPMLFSPVGTMGDKLRIIRLANLVSQLSNEDIFNVSDHSTLEDLESFGFSDRIIHQFFKPFFSGIFLENDLKTSHRMFRFVFKMFATGRAAIPSGGIQAISDQLAERLKRTEIHKNLEVKSVLPNRIKTTKGDVPFDKLIIATRPEGLLKGFAYSTVSYREAFCLYYSADQATIDRPMLGLVPGESLINNFHYATALNPAWAPKGKHLLSATVVGPQNIEIKELEKRVTEELTSLTKTNVSHLKTFHIRQALPVIDDMRYSMQPTATKVQDGIFLAGDHLLNPSLNAAMMSGRIAANALINS